MSPIAPTRLDTVEEDKTDASVRSGVTDEHKETGLGDSRVALVAKAL